MNSHNLIIVKVRHKLIVLMDSYNLVVPRYRHKLIVLTISTRQSTT